MDPTKIHLEHSSVNPVLDHEASFQEIMSEQLAHAPWLLLSIAVHTSVIGLLSLIPAAPAKHDDPRVTMQIADKEPVIEEAPRSEEQPLEERAAEEPRLQDAEVEPTEREATGEAGEAAGFEEAATGSGGDGTASAFDSGGWNTVPGLGAGAGGRYGDRPGGRDRLRRSGSGGKMTDHSIDAGLLWLKKHQDSDGKWDADEFMRHDVQGDPCNGPGDPLHDVGVTGLALLAFLGDGSTMKSGPFKDVIRNGVMWLRSQQQEDTGLIGTDASHHFIYDHVIATLAMCEAYGLSNYRSLKPNAQRAINYLEAHRNPYGCWRYQRQAGDNDMSVTGWAVLAYISAKEFGLLIDPKALAYADSYIDELTDANGRTGYIDKGGLSSRHKGAPEVEFPADRTECMTAVSLLCKCFLGHDPKKSPMLDRQAKLLMRKPPQWNKQSTGEGKGSWVDHYYWYYGTYAMYQVGGPAWNQWSKAVNDAVIKKQRADGNANGSWDPEDAWGADGGRVYSTAILVLTLEASYRYARVIGGR